MTKQEILTKAVTGLRDQKWVRSLRFYGGSCSYDDGAGRRCGWGHVDPSLGAGEVRNVHELHRDGVGVAATLNLEELDFAKRVQLCHDRNHIPSEMEDGFRILAQSNNLTFPEAP